MSTELPDGSTRRRVLQSGALAVAAASVPGVALAQRPRGGESLKTIVSTLATAESFGVTFLTEAVKRAPGTPSAGLVDTLKAANTAEYDHVVTLRQLGGRQFTLRFWIPDAAFGGGGPGLFASIETADTVELMGYLTAVTAFARRGQERPARWLAEAAAIESEHRAIARFAQGALGGEQKISIDRSFAPWSIRTVAGMIDALEEAGIGFGRRGAAPGKFYDFPGDPTRNGFRPGQQRPQARVMATLATRSSVRSDPAVQAFLLLRIGFTVAPILFGLDKFAGVLTDDWTKYLATQFNDLIPGSAQDAMYMVGVVEILAGLIVALNPRIGGLIVAAWLAGIIVNLLLVGGYGDVALRDFGLLLGALALSRLATMRR